MKIIGLCGGSGSGKGTVSSIFASYGIPSVDTDAVYRRITSCDTPCLRALAEEFGNDIISHDGSLNRKMLGQIVFSDNSEERLNKLNSISHSYILDETREILKGYKNEGCFAAIVDAPLLFESGFDKECDVIIAVLCDRDTRIERIVKRDNIDRLSAEKRIDAQLTDEELKAKARFCIYNDGDIPSLEKKIKLIIKKMK